MLTSEPEPCQEIPRGEAQDQPPGAGRRGPDERMRRLLASLPKPAEAEREILLALVEAQQPIDAAAARPST